MTGKFDAYVLWPLAKRVQSWIVDRSTARDFTVAILYLTILHELNGTSIDNFVVWSFPVFLSSVFATYAWHEFWTCSHNHFINFHHCNKGWNLAFGQFQKLFEKTAISTTKNQNLLTLKKETNNLTWQCTIMVIQVVKFSRGDKKLERFLPKFQRKLFNFVNWC